MLLRHFSTVALVILGAVACYAGYRMVRGNVAERVYLERLGELRASYETLQDRYNEAVRKTAVTELLVKDGQLSVIIRDTTGATRVIPTSCDPTREVYVDYVVVDGRLWIRRVFDASTPPEQAVVIDPALASVDWQRQGVAHGKAAYRQLAEGRWVITVTGDGSLGLVRMEADAVVDLAAAPRVNDYATIERDVRRAVERIGPVDVVRYLAGG